MDDRHSFKPLIGKRYKVTEHKVYRGEKPIKQVDKEKVKKRIKEFEEKYKDE